MKTVLMLLALAATALPIQARAFPIPTVRIFISVTNGAPAYSVNSRDVDRKTLTLLVKKVGTIDTNQLIAIVADRSVAVPDFMDVLLEVYAAGLQNVVLSSQASRDGQFGQITLSATITTRPLYGDIVGHQETGGFQTNETEFIQWLRYDKRPWEIP